MRRQFVNFHSAQHHSVTTVALNCYKIIRATPAAQQTNKQKFSARNIIRQSVPTSLDILVVKETQAYPIQKFM